MNEQNDLKEQVAVLRSQLYKINADEKLTISQKANKIVSISRAIRKLYKLNLQETDKRIKDALSSKETIQNPVVHESLDDPSEKQPGLKTQVAILNRLNVIPGTQDHPTNLKGGMEIYCGTFESIMNDEPIKDEVKRALKLADEVLYLYELNIKESQKRMKVANVNAKFGFKLETPLYFEELDEQPY